MTINKSNGKTKLGYNIHHLPTRSIITAYFSAMSAATKCLCSTRLLATDLAMAVSSVYWYSCFPVLSGSNLKSENILEDCLTGRNLGLIDGIRTIHHWTMYDVLYLLPVRYRMISASYDWGYSMISSDE